MSAYTKENTDDEITSRGTGGENSGSPQLRELVCSKVIRDFQQGCAAALLSIGKLSEKESGAFSAKFGNLLDQFRKMNSQSFTRLYEWPSVIAWTRELFSVVQRHATTRDPESEKLALELVRYGESFLIAEALAGRTEISFEPALNVPLPFHIPASRYVIDGTGFSEGLVAIAGASARGVRLKSGKELEPGNGLYEVPVYEPAVGIEIQLSPAALITPWASMPFAIPALGLQNYQERHYDLLSETLEVISRFAPEDYQTLKEVMRVMALKPVVPGRTLNASYSEFPGACVLSVVNHPYEMAVFLIHEMHHSLLSAYEAKGALLPSEQLIEESKARCYSPWRNDLRPPRGILHALTVFDAVCKFWFEVLESKPLDSNLEQYAKDQLVRGIIQRLTGLASFATVGMPTQRGKDLIQALSAGVDEHVERARLLGLHADIPSLEVWPDGTIRPETLVRDGPALTLHDSLFNHASKYDTENWAVPWMAARKWIFNGFQKP